MVSGSFIKKFVIVLQQLYMFRKHSNLRSLLQLFPCFGLQCENLLTIPLLKDLPAVVGLLLGSCLERHVVGD